METKEKTISIDDWMYCPTCHSFNKIKGSITAKLNQDIYLNVEPLAENVECARCKDYMVHIDNDIFESIKILNNKGYETLFSCQGHSIGDIGYVCFADIPSRYLKQNIEPPKKWFYEYSQMWISRGLSPEQRLTLRPVSGEISRKGFEVLGIKWDDLHNEEMTNLLNWADELPNLLDSISNEEKLHYSKCPVDIHQLAEKLCISEYELFRDIHIKCIPYRIFEGKIWFDDVDYIIDTFYPKFIPIRTEE